MEAVKTLVIALGVRPAARQLNLAEPTVQRWSAKYGWLKQPEPTPIPLSIRPTTVTTKPADALKNALADDSKATRLSLSRAARKAAQTLEEAPGAVVIKQAQNMRHVAATAAQVHSWDQQRSSSGPVTLNIMADNAAVQVLSSTEQDSQD